MADRSWGRVQQDAALMLPNLELETFFDIGANTGQSAEGIAEAFGRVAIWSFEPVQATYAALRQNTAHLSQVRTFPFALGAVNDTGHVSAAGTAVGNRLVVGPGEDTQEVQIVAGDSFCAEHGVDRINYLKVDTEGNDLQVLRGFHEKLGRAEIDLVQVEVSMNPDNTLHVPLASIAGYVEPMGYRLYRLYEPFAERRVIGGIRHAMPNLRRINPVFVSPRVIAENARPLT